MIEMFAYPKELRPKDLKKISKYDCDEKIKDVYIKYLTNYSFNEFVRYCEDSDGALDDLIFKFTDLQLERFEPNSLIWVSHVLINFLIYFDVNLDYGYCYDAYASALQFSVLFLAMNMLVEKLSFDEVELPHHSRICFEKLFNRCPDFKFNLEKDCNLAYKSFNNDFEFTGEEFYLKVNECLDRLPHAGL